MKSRTNSISLLLIYLIINAEAQRIGFLPQDHHNRFLAPASRCGTDYADANSKCGKVCPSGTDADCPSGQHCFGEVPCSQPQGGGSSSGGTSSSSGKGTARCGKDYADANDKCGQPCPSGTDGDCPSGQHCFGGVTCTKGGSGPETHECGANLECPLKACCSKFGYCGWTKDFCNKDCQSNCELNPKPPACDGSQKMTRQVAYYESWAANRSCTPIKPSDLNPALYTHMNYAFAYVSQDNKLVPAEDSDIPLYKDFTALKSINPKVKIMIAVGGWAFNDPPYQNRFSNMASSKANRQTFINSAVSFMGKYGFDGIDIDWEYPAADDRGGKPEDLNNFVSLLQEMRAAFKNYPSKFEISITVPISNWYLRHFDLSKIPDAVDFFNVMAYDIHGVWDANIKSIGPYVRSHTNISEIEDSLNIFFKNGVQPAKLVLGTGAYGRTWTLSDPNCYKPGCKFTGPGKAGQCTKAAGTLAYFEIVDLLSTNKQVKTVYDQGSMSNYAYYGNQWISYDDSGTFSQRKAWADGKCLGGIMLWSADMINTNPSNIQKNEEAFASKAGISQADLEGDQGGTTSGDSTAGFVQFQQKIVGIAHSCATGFFKNIPPSFCWKKGGDAGKIPTDCPSGYFRNLALCYENCHDGYEFSGGVCWEKCKDGYQSQPASCYKSLIPKDWYFKKSYIPKSLTNFQVTCPDGQYLSGALCYRDCTTVGLDNCGIGACASSSDLCTSSIAEMAVDFALGVAQAVLFVVSLGTSSEDGTAFQAARQSVKDAFSKLSKSDKRTAAQQAEDAINRMTPEKMKEKMTDFAVSTVVQGIAGEVVKEICDKVGDALIGQLKTNNKKDANQEVNVQDYSAKGLNITAITGVDCKDTDSSNGKIICAKTIMQAASFVDPTGLVTMATSFMQPVCDVK